ncbi:hypothetical protein [Massilia rhizosphaerae]|uniref:hypothetical protein n=1 Tax=Massilia rhizosphaerae TaxID=2784389 RepID=UPI0018DEB5BB|nr:hypothetical protein [Massilia rhizosphaerae]
MRPEDKPQFAALLAEVLAGYGKPLPEKAEINIWFSQLAPFPPSTIKMAFEAYRVERPDFAPVPNGIAARCKLQDGRPDENEAWAVALTSQDERETVVWTSEMAEAFTVARPLLTTGDEIGARMAFKDAYKRLMNEARALNRPVSWAVSAGWDAERHQLAVQRAITAGLLPAPEPHLALPNDSGIADQKPVGLQKLLEAAAQLEDPRAKAERLHEARLVEEENADRERRRALDERVQAYLRQHPDARYGELLAPTRQGKR